MAQPFPSHHGDLQADSRPARLARGLRQLGVQRGDPIVVACCPEHPTERAVAEEAASLVHARAIELYADEPLVERPKVVVACVEGLSRWIELKIPARVVAEGMGDCVIWWTALELLNAREPRVVDMAARCARQPST